MWRLLSGWRRSSSSAAYALFGGMSSSQPNHDSYPSPPSSSSTSTFEVDDDLDLGELTEKHSSRKSLSFRLRRLFTPSGLTSLLLFLISTIITYLPLLLPSYITTFYHRLITPRHAKPAPTASNPKKLSKTAYLDGLRGVAALIVYIFHFNYLFWPILRNGYASSESPTENSIFQLPILRVLHSGRSSVTIFFIISGFVLTLKTVTAIHRSPNPSHDVLDGLAGSLFRRPFRLYLPILVSTGITAILSQSSSSIFIPNLQGGDVPPRKANFTDQFWHWLAVTERMVNPFQAVTGRQNLWGNDYNGHLWTIPTEFKGSVMVFVLMLAFCRSKRWVHFVGVLGAGYWQMVKGDFDMTLFCVGLLLAEISIVIPPTGAWALKIHGGVRHGFTGFLAVLGCHLMSYPEARGPSSPGFRTLSGMVPTFYKGNEERIQQFWISVGSILFVVALMYSPVVLTQWWQRRGQLTESGEDQGEPLLQKLFTNSFSQYLGQISYSLYLWHGMVNHAIGLRYLHPMAAEWNTAERGVNGLVSGGFPEEGAAVRATALRTYAWKWAWTFVFNTFVLFWVSDVFHRGVDVYAVKLTRKISTWALARK